MRDRTTGRSEHLRVVVAAGHLTDINRGPTMGRPLGEALQNLFGH